MKNKLIIIFIIIAIIMKNISTVCFMTCPHPILFKGDTFIFTIFFLIIPLFFIFYKKINLVKLVGYLIVVIIYILGPNIIVNISEKTSNTSILNLIKNIDHEAYKIAKNNNDYKICENIVEQNLRTKCFHETDPEYLNFETNCNLYEKSFLNIKNNYRRSVVEDNEESYQIRCFSDKIYAYIKNKQEINCSIFDNYKNLNKFYQIKNLCKTAKKFQESVNNNNCEYFTNINVRGSDGFYAKKMFYEKCINYQKGIIDDLNFIDPALIGFYGKIGGEN